MKEADGLANCQSPGTPNPLKRKRQAFESPSQSGEVQFYRLARTRTTVTHHYPTIYDYLSNIQLTRRALEELDRRHGLLPEPRTPIAPNLVENPTRSLPLRSGEISTGLQRFARRGGPDISDLKGFPQPVLLPSNSHGHTQTSSPPSTMPSTGSKRKSGGSQSTKVRFSTPLATSPTHRVQAIASTSRESECGLGC